MFSVKALVAADSFRQIQPHKVQSVARCVRRVFETSLTNVKLGGGRHHRLASERRYLSSRWLQLYSRFVDLRGRTGRCITLRESWTGTSTRLLWAQRYLTRRACYLHGGVFLCRIRYSSIFVYCHDAFALIYIAFDIRCCAPGEAQGFVVGGDDKVGRRDKVGRYDETGRFVFGECRRACSL